MELPKLNEFESVEDIEDKGREDNLVPWALFLGNLQSEMMKMIKERIEELKRVAERLEVLSMMKKQEKFMKADRKRYMIRLLI